MTPSSLRSLAAFALAALASSASAAPQEWSGIYPALAYFNNEGECGTGAVVPWADRLWAVGYVAHIRGSGLGLYEMRGDLSWRLHPASVTGTFANRFVHWPSEQVFIGPHAIDAKGNVRTIEALRESNPDMDADVRALQRLLEG